ncbi:MAG TPA: hypothetical protein VJV78_29650 [Polyangiales bacterium]|nr:hypothetical protein [Polyangiales bacterium]
MLGFYARATRRLCVPQIERRIALLAFVCTLPSLAMGLHSDDYFLRQNILERGPLAAYSFISRDPQAAHARVLEQRTSGRAPWWTDEHPRASFFRPLSSLSLWLDFANGLPLWWMHLQNCAIYGVLVWLAILLYRQLGLSDAGLGWAALFFGLDAPVAQSVGWIAGRDTLLGVSLGMACILMHDRARRAGRPLLLALACVCFALSLLSGEIGLCTIGYLTAHALAVDRGSVMRRVLALAPYGLVTGVYLAHYLTAGYGFGDGGIYRDVTSSPAIAIVAWLESMPIWLATTVSLPLASFQFIVPDFRLPLLLFSLAVLAAFLPLLGSRSIQEPHARMFAIGALLSLLPLAATLPQERLRFFAAFGVFGLLGPWVASHFEALGRVRRWAARIVWGIHGVWLPLLFVPFLFSISSLSEPVHALDQALPRAKSPVAILLNPPGWAVPWLQITLRESHGEVCPPIYALYAGSQPLEVERVDDRSLELRVARSWFVTPFENHIRNVARAPFRAGDRIALAHGTVEVREVNEAGAPTRARFTFDRSLDDPALAFHCWEGKKVALWTPPPVGGRAQLPAAAAF